MEAKTLTLQSSHVAMLAKPKEVAGFIAESAESGSNDSGCEVELSERNGR
jgi:hypothetical protein